MCLPPSSKKLKICPESIYVVMYWFLPLPPPPLPCLMRWRHPFAALTFIVRRCSCAAPSLGGSSWSTLTAGKERRNTEGTEKMTSWFSAAGGEVDLYMCGDGS